MTATVPTCRRGHPILATTSGWYTHSNGRRYARCKLCIALRAKLRYQQDPAYREAQKTVHRNAYHAKRKAQCTAL